MNRHEIYCNLLATAMNASAWGRTKHCHGLGLTAQTLRERKRRGIRGDAIVLSRNCHNRTKRLRREVCIDCGFPLDAKSMYVDRCNPCYLKNVRPNRYQRRRQLIGAELDARIQSWGMEWGVL